MKILVYLLELLLGLWIYIWAFLFLISIPLKSGLHAKFARWSWRKSKPLVKWLFGLYIRFIRVALKFLWRCLVEATQHPEAALGGVLVFALVLYLMYVQISGEWWPR